MLQCVAVCCSVLRVLPAFHFDCNTLQFTATRYNSLQHTCSTPHSYCNTRVIFHTRHSLHHIATHCNTLQHTATHMQYSIFVATQRNTHCNTHGNARYNILQHTLQHILQHALQHAATHMQHCTFILQHTGPPLHCTFIATQSVCCCSVLQCVAVNVQCAEYRDNAIDMYACCSVLQCVAVCCSVLQRVAVRCN